MSNSKRDPFRDYGAFWRPYGGDPLGQMHLSRKTLATSMIEAKAIRDIVTRGGDSRSAEGVPESRGRGDDM